MIRFIRWLIQRHRTQSRVLKNAGVTPVRYPATLPDVYGIRHRASTRDEVYDYLASKIFGE